jgi:hypothetical protein
MAGVCADIGARGAKEVLGVDVGPPVQELDNFMPNCIFFAANGSETAVGITIYPGQRRTDVLFQGYGHATGMVAVSGVGDKALAVANGTFLIARRGATGCGVTLTGRSLPGTPQSRDEHMGAFCAKALG